MDPTSKFAAAMQSEAIVSVVWLSIFAQVFPMPQYLIAPECWLDNGHSRCDLVVYNFAGPGNPRSVFVLEGKKAATSGFSSRSTQLVGYLDEIKTQSKSSKEKALPSVDIDRDSTSYRPY